MTADGRRVTVRWPGGPHDFVMVDAAVEPSPIAGMMTVTGQVVEPYREWATFYAYPDGDGYALMRKLDWTPIERPAY